MSTMPITDEKGLARRSSPLVGWLLVAGGVFFLGGGQMHPREDLPGASMTEQLQVMYEDPAWYPAHVLLLIGTALIAAALVALVRGRSLASTPPAHLAAVVAAIATSLAVPGMLLHLVAASDADRISHHQSTPITDVHLILEPITVPAFSFSIAALALIGAATHTLGNWWIAALGIVGGIGYGLAGATFWFTHAFDVLFPLAVGIALWAIVVGIGLLRRRASRAS